MITKEVIETGSDFSGVGAFDQSISELKISHKRNYACDMDKFSRKTYIHNFGTKKDIETLNHPDVIFCDDIYYKYSNPKLSRPKISDYKKLLKIQEKTARLFSFYYPWNVNYRKIDLKPLDIYMTSPPCQAFSLAGKRKGESDKRGVLFYNSHNFIKINKPKKFIFENVKGLLSDNNGKTFKRWIDLLGGKSVNGNPVLFPEEDSVPYHVYFKVLNAKKYGVPQNRERIFIVGIRDDSYNIFRWPKEQPLLKRLKDVLEEDVDRKYYLSDKMLEGFKHNGGSKGVIADLNKGGERGKVYSDNSDVMSCLTATDYKQPKQIAIKSATKSGYELAELGDSINLSNPNSETRRGRVGKGISQTLDTSCNQGIMVHYVQELVNVRKYEVDIPKLQKVLKEHKHLSNKKIALELKVKKTTVDHWFRTDSGFSIPHEDIWFALKAILKITTDEFDKSITTFELKPGVYEKSNRVYDSKGIAPTMTSASADEKIMIGAIRGRNPDNPKCRKKGFPKEQMLEINENGTSNALTTVQKDNVVVYNKQEFEIRRLTPRECFRLMSFPDDFKLVCSDAQLYKQAGNSIVVKKLKKLISKLIL